MLKNRTATFCFKSFFFGSVLSLGLSASTEVLAEQIMRARAGDHDGYSRVVFEWDRAPSYSAQKQGSAISLTFNEAASADLSSVQGASLRNIGGVSLTSSSGKPVSVSVSVAPDAKYRHFQIGQRVVVDIYDSKGNAPKITAKKQPEPVKKKTQAQVRKEVESGKQIVVDTVEAQPIAKYAKASVVEDPHVITLSATKKVGMAVFERAGYLWLVVDDPSISVPPQLKGPEKKKFPKFERMDIPGGVAYRLPKTDDYNVYAEGGGLLWRVVLTPNERRLKPAEPENSLDGISDIAGGTVLWPLVQPRKKLEVKDPIIGDTIHIVSVEDAGQYTGDVRHYVDMQVLKSVVGLALISKVDDLAVGLSPKGVTATKTGGLSLSSSRDTASVLLKDQLKSEEEQLNEYGEALPELPPLKKIYSFKSWEMGGPIALEENRRVLMVGMGDKDGYGKVEDLLTLAKLNVANNRGLEALGLLRVAENELAGIDKNPEFIALHGAAATLAGQYDVAIPSLFDEELQKYGEVDIWKAVALAGAEDWSQAGAVMPENLDLVAEYPKQIRYPLALKLAEAALRSGRGDEAEGLLALIDRESKRTPAPIKAAYDYLYAELNRQRGDHDKAGKEWKKLTKSRDDFYRAKSALALTRLQLEDKKITPSEAINRLETLRYAWRGDELETLINYRLGRVYIDNKNYLKGLSVLRNAVSLSPDSIIAKEVTSYMTDTFRSLFLEGKLNEITTLDAVSIYDEFKELTPAGSDGDVFVQKLAENLVSVDLLGRAGSLLENQLVHRLAGEDAVRVGLRLSAIRLLDDKPDGALRALDLTDQAIDRVAAQNSKPYTEERAESKLLRARALSELNRTGEAVEMLDVLAKRRGNDPNIARLKGDMAWRAGRWDDAAEAFQDLILSENISLTRPATDSQRDLLMNRAIALNLAGNRIALANLREKYGDVMKQTNKARMFELVTRPRQMGLLGSRDSVESLMSEVDLFGEFLESYRTMGGEG